MRKEEKIKNLLRTVEKQINSIERINDDLNISFLQALAIKEILDEFIKLCDNKISQEEVDLINKTYSKEDISNFYEHYHEIRNLLLKNPITEKKEKQILIKRINTTKSTVIRKNILRLISIKNIIIRLFLAKEPSFLSHLQNLRQLQRVTKK